MASISLQHQPLQSNKLLQRVSNEDTIQRNKLQNGFKNPTTDFSDVSGNGTFATRQVTKHSEIAKLAKALSDHLMDTEDVDQDIIILTGCHGDQSGNLIYNEDDFSAEDNNLLKLKGKDEIGFLSKVINMKGLTKEEQIEKMQNNDDIVLILSWCYSAETYKNIKHYKIIG